MSGNYDSLVRLVLDMHASAVRLGGVNPTGRSAGEIDALRGILHWVEGREATDLEGLRQKYMGES